MTRSEYSYAYQSGFRPTVRFLISKGVPHDVAEDAAQAAWTRGWERIHQMRDDDLLTTWINSIAMNLYRREACLDRRTQPLEDVTGEAGIDTAPMDVARVLEACGDSERELLTQQLEGHTTSEIAHRIGASETAVRIRLMRARRCARAVIGK